MQIDVLTIFPEMFTSLNISILGRAIQDGYLVLNIHDIRDFSQSKHRNTDDYPFGGGAGMLMMAQPIADAIKHVTSDSSTCLRIYLSPRGVPLTQKLVKHLALQPHLLLLCGHYEGVDERILEKYIDLEISIGDYVLTGGELPAMVLIDSIARMLDGVLGGTDSTIEESFTDDLLLEYPQYTRPRNFEGMLVPDVLLSGHHAEIEKWRREQRLLITAERRPELLKKAKLSEAEQEWLKQQILNKNI